MNKSITIAGTGHRPNKLWGYDLNHPMYIRLREGIVNYIIKLAKTNEQINVISGMALGFDTVLAQSALIARQHGYNIKLICAIPCANHSAKWHGSSVSEWNRITNLADTVHYVSSEPYNNSCMQNRNIYMVNNCNILLALWNGTPGGTANCVSYAKSQNKQIVKIRQQ